MDIYGYAESMDYAADYYDFNTGRIYKIQEFGQELAKGNTDARIRVTDESGNHIGWANRLIK